MKFRWCLLLSLLAALGCEEKSAPAAPAAGPQEVESAESKGGALRAAQAPSPKGNSAEPKRDASGAGTQSGTSCLAGKWRYDYSDNALEAMMATLEGGKVTKEEGALICTMVGESSGTVSCTGEGGKPIVNEVEATQGGLPFKLHMEISGTGTSKFQVKDDKTLHIAGSAEGLKVKAEVTLGGQKMPFPAQEMVSVFGSEGEVDVQFECRGDQLKMLHQVEGMKTDWQVMTRVK